MKRKLNRTQVYAAYHILARFYPKSYAIRLSMLWRRYPEALALDSVEDVKTELAKCKLEHEAQVAKIDKLIEELE